MTPRPTSPDRTATATATASLGDLAANLADPAAFAQLVTTVDEDLAWHYVLLRGLATLTSTQADRRAAGTAIGIDLPPADGPTDTRTTARRHSDAVIAACHQSVTTTRALTDHVIATDDWHRKTIGPDHTHVAAWLVRWKLGPSAERRLADLLGLDHSRRPPGDDGTRDRRRIDQRVTDAVVAWQGTTPPVRQAFAVELARQLPLSAAHHSGDDYRAAAFLHTALTT